MSNERLLGDEDLWAEVQKGREEREAKLARLLYGENRQDLTPEEAAAIVNTVRNRALQRRLPPEEVVEQNRGGRYQYSPFNPTNPNYPEIQNFGPEHPEWGRYLDYVRGGLKQQLPFTHYYSASMEVPPSWSKNLKGLTRIGSHWFGTEEK